MDLLGIELASLAPADQFLHVCYCRGLVETRSEGLADDGSSTDMIATDARVDLLEQLSSLFLGDTLLEDA